MGMRWLRQTGLASYELFDAGESCLLLSLSFIVCKMGKTLVPISLD